MATKKVYVCRRLGQLPQPGEIRVEVHEAGLDPRPLLHWPRHSPTGFEWGYGGSGPADLALAILSDHLEEVPGTDDAWCDELYQQFKSDFIAGADRQGFTLSSDVIGNWVSAHAGALPA